MQGLERDVLRKLSLTGRDPEVTPLRELMTTPVELATTSTQPGEALTIMLERHFRHLPVVDEKGRAQAIVSMRSLLEEKVKELHQQLDSLESYISADGIGG